jgi:hypothetical protein
MSRSSCLYPWWHRNLRAGKGGLHPVEDAPGIHVLDF